MLAITAWVWSAGSRLREVSWRKVAITVFWPPVRTMRPVSGSFIPGLGDVLLEPAERARDGPVLGVDHAGVAADERGEGDRFRGREGEVAAGAVQDLPVLAAPAELGARAVRHLAFEDRPEGAGIDRARQPELFRAPAGPGARLLVLRIVLRVVAVRS